MSTSPATSAATAVTAVGVDMNSTSNPSWANSPASYAPQTGMKEPAIEVKTSRTLSGAGAALGAAAAAAAGLVAAVGAAPLDPVVAPDAAGFAGTGPSERAAQA